MPSGYYGFDFDGTLFTKVKGGGVATVGSPITPMIEKLKECLAAGIECRIITARYVLNEGTWNKRQVKMIHEALAENGVPALQVQAHKCFRLLRLYDDRAVQVETNTGRILGVED